MAAEAAKAEGNKALQAKNYDEAIKKYTEAIAFDATQHTYFSNRAAAYMQLKDYERALQDAESCIKLNPTWAKGYSRKGAALHAMKKYDAADAAYHEGLAVAPGDASLKQGVVDVNKAKGAQQSQQNNPMAQAFGPNLIAKIAQDPNLRHKLGDEQFMMKLKLLQSNPQQMMSTMFQDPDMCVCGVCHIYYWCRVAAMASRESDSFASRVCGVASTACGGRVYASIGGAPSHPRRRRRRWRGPRRRRRGTRDGRESARTPSTRESDAITARNDRRSQVMSLALGINLQQPGSAQDAGAAPPPPAPKKEPEPEPEPEVERTPEEQKAYDQKQLALAHKAKGNAAYKKRDFDAALKHYDDAISADPGDVTYRNNKCAVHFEKKDYDAVLSEGREAIKVGREHRADYELVHKIYVRMGKARMKQGDLEGALEEFNNAQVEHRDKATERLVKNLEMDIKKKKREAYIDPEKALEEKEKGNVKFREGKFSESVPFYEEAMKRDPKNPAYPNNLAAALTKLGNFAAAKQACEKALELDEKYVKAIAKKGDLEMLMKEYHKAIETYKKGLTIEPSNAACKQGLQRVQTAIYNEGGDKGRAEQAMKDPEIQAILQDPMVRQVIQDLSGGNGAAGQQAMNDPVMRGKIEKLIASGVLQTK
mmetsp:Transcript_25911/g.67171  ORF Transcript_25911/g.67171 Transcript_25911/m.67171 type:complete len:651 (+) Transcript_25911:188-2140(+)